MELNILILAVYSFDKAFIYYYVPDTTIGTGSTVTTQKKHVSALIELTF